MRPSVVLLGFLLGSSSAICFGLVGVAFVFWWLGPEYPQLRGEVAPLIGHLLRFAALTTAAGVSFYGLLRQRPWRRLGIGALVLVLAVVVLAYTVPLAGDGG